MVSPQKDIPKDGTVSSLDAQRVSLPEPHRVARRSLHKPCPICGSITVSARDGRDMCLICGYLQAHA